MDDYWQHASVKNMGNQNETLQNILKHVAKKATPSMSGLHDGIEYTNQNFNYVFTRKQSKNILFPKLRN